VGGIPPPKTLTIPLQTAAKLCALNLFFGRDNELQIYHGNFLLMDNKHRKLFVIKQSKGCKFIPKMYLKSCARTRWGSLYAPTDPLSPMTLTSRGGSEGEGRRHTSEGDGREERGREFHPQVNASTPSVYTSPQRR